MNMPETHAAAILAEPAVDASVAVSTNRFHDTRLKRLAYAALPGADRAQENDFRMSARRYRGRARQHQRRCRNLQLWPLGQEGCDPLF